MLCRCSHTFGGLSIAGNSKIFPVVHEATNELALAHLSYLLPHSLLFSAISSTAFLFYFFFSLIPASHANCHQMALIILYLLFFLQCSLQYSHNSLSHLLWAFGWHAISSELLFLIPFSKVSPPTHISYLVLSVSFPLTLRWVFFTALFHSANCHKEITIIIFTVNKSQYCITHFHKTLLFTEQTLCLVYNRCPTITC